MVIKSHAKHRMQSRKRSWHNEAKYEKKVRRTFTPDEEVIATKKLRPLLPIKEKSGLLVKQFTDDDVQEKAVEENQISSVPENEMITAEKQVTLDPLTQAKMSLQDSKNKIAKICSDIVNDPEKQFRSLKTMQQMIWTKDPPEICAVIRKLAIASLNCVFLDIIPGYRIRARTEEEKDVKLSKKVKSLIEFEESLLHYYQIYLQDLEKIIKRKDKRAKSSISGKKDDHEVIMLAVRSLCELYEKLPHFNFHNNIAVVLVPLTNDKDKTISELCCNAVISLFRSDKSGESTLSTITVLCKLIKDTSGSRKEIRPEVLDTLLSLPINHVDFDAMSISGKSKPSIGEKKKMAQEKKKLSRGQLKYRKRQEKLESELKATEAMEKRETVLKYHTEIIQQVFLVYFRILKQKKDQGRPEKLVNSVMEGLSQFAHLINIDFFSDLIQVLQNLISSGELNQRQSLCCIATAFKVLSGQGEALNIDPAEFYKHLYNSLFDLLDTLEQQKTREKNKCDIASDLTLMVECLNIMLNQRRKQITLSRLLAFIKRLATLALHMYPSSSTQVILDSVVNLLKCNSKTNALFDIESQTKGVYLPELPDPEHCGASSACIWEIHALRRHYCPEISKEASKIVRDFIREQQGH